MKHWILRQFYIIVQLYLFIYLYYFNVRHGLNTQVSAYKFLTGIARTRTSQMYHMSTELDATLFLAPYEASSRSRAAKVAIEICLR